jgi:membrane protein YdbS with pleckstrin-like domain
MDEDAARRRLGAQGLRPVSPGLIRARYLAALVWDVISLLIAIACVVVGAVLDLWWMYPLAVIPILWCLPALLLTPRRVRAIGYLDGEDELVSASGIMFRSVSSTPYGRIQSVEINEGPIERHLGLATLSWSTAADGADGEIPGLPREEAERLRTLLTTRGIERMQSL